MFPGIRRRNRMKESKSIIKEWHRKLKQKQKQNRYNQDFPGDTVIKNLPANPGDTGLSLGPGRSHMPRSN